MNKNLALSMQFAVELRPSRGMCFDTAYRVCQMLPGSWYVEGTIGGIPHAWVEWGGEIIDAQLPTATQEYRRIRRSRATTMSRYEGWLPRFILP